MKTKEELNALKEEVETLNKKPHELTDEELEQVTGGRHGWRGKPGKPGRNGTPHPVCGDPMADVAKNVTDTTYVVSFSREDADVTAGQFTVRVAGDGIVKTSGTIDGIYHVGTGDLIIDDD